MRRWHLFEFGDQQWFPQFLRNAETAYLATSYRLLPRLRRRWVERLSTVLHAGEPAEILDLCSGAGGPIPSIVDELERHGYQARARLTDLYPNPKTASHPSVVWLAESVDATRVSPELAGVRTKFSAFHHFRPDAARAILKDAFDHRRAICIFEAGSGTMLAAATMLGVPLAVLALMPFSRPFRWAYCAFTYLIPLMPFIVLWDGMVSLLRIYSPEQMKRLTEGLQAPDYTWEIGGIPAVPDRAAHWVEQLPLSGILTDCERHGSGQGRQLVLCPWLKLKVRVTPPGSWSCSASSYRKRPSLTVPGDWSCLTP